MMRMQAGEALNCQDSTQVRPVTLAVGKHAPVAVFAYARADRLAAMMDSLCQCAGFAESEITIFVDGPRSARDAAAVEAVRAYVRALDLPNVTARISEENRGLRQSVHAGVTEMCARHGRVIVLEDDLVLSTIALEYFNSALTRYEEVEEIWSIAGYLYDAPRLRDRDTALVLPFAHPWGWATWARAWRHFELDARPSDVTLRSRAFRAAFDMNGLYPFTQQLRQSIAGRVNSWYIHWYYTIFAHGGSSVFPPRRVLDNFGISRGTHGGRFNPHEALVRRPALRETTLQLPDCPDVDYAALDHLKRSWEAKVQRFIARAGRVKRMLLTGVGTPH